MPKRFRKGYYANGAKYEGQWVVNLKDGYAVFTKENGEIFKGIFKNDRMVKESDINFQDKKSL